MRRVNNQATRKQAKMRDMSACNLLLHNLARGITLSFIGSLSLQSHITSIVRLALVIQLRLSSRKSPSDISFRRMVLDVLCFPLHSSNLGLTISAKALVKQQLL